MTIEQMIVPAVDQLERSMASRFGASALSAVLVLCCAIHGAAAQPGDQPVEPPEQPVNPPAVGGGSTNDPPPPSLEDLVETLREDEQIQEDKRNKRDFAGISFGVGIGIIVTTADDIIEEAELVPESIPDGCAPCPEQIIRAKTRRDKAARLLLETHYFFLLQDWLGIGPFFAVQPGAKEVVEAAGAGLMLGFRREDRAQSFNLGVGMLLEPSVKTLGDGLEKNKPLPMGDRLRFQTKPILSLLIIGSFAF